MKNDVKKELILFLPSHLLHTTSVEHPLFSINLCQAKLVFHCSHSDGSAKDYVAGHNQELEGVKCIHHKPFLCAMLVRSGE
jgi:hypothetical protein